MLYVVIPLVAGAITRSWLIGRAGGGTTAEAAVSEFTGRLKPVSVVGLLATVVLLFGFQGTVILANPMLIVLIAVPPDPSVLRHLRHRLCARRRPGRSPSTSPAPCALIGTSNFFELAVAVAISLFGLNSGAALATVVGVLVEVPVMLSLVAFAKPYDAARGSRKA